MEMAKRQTTVKNARQVSADRTSRVLSGTIKRLHRLGGRRASREVKQAYKDAAELIKGIAARKRR